MKTEQEIVDRMRELRKSIDEDSALIDAFQDGRHLFTAISEVQELAQRLSKNVMTLQALLWVTDNEIS